MSKYNITMKQKSDSNYNELYPESLDTQIKLSKDTTGFTGTNVSQVLMELNNKIPGGMAEAGMLLKMPMILQDTVQVGAAEQDNMFLLLMIEYILKKEKKDKVLQ